MHRRSRSYQRHDQNSRDFARTCAIKSRFRLPKTTISFELVTSTLPASARVLTEPPRSIGHSPVNFPSRQTRSRLGWLGGAARASVLAHGRLSRQQGRGPSGHYPAACSSRRRRSRACWTIVCERILLPPITMDGCSPYKNFSSLCHCGHFPLRRRHLPLPTPTSSTR